LRQRCSAFPGITQRHLTHARMLEAAYSERLAAEPAMR
jgi:hypothetical protein